MRCDGKAQITQTVYADRRLIVRRKPPARRAGRAVAQSPLVIASLNLVNAAAVLLQPFKHCIRRPFDLSNVRAAFLTLGEGSR
jgi:hypothetical protein